MTRIYLWTAGEETIVQVIAVSQTRRPAGGDPRQWVRDSKRFADSGNWGYAQFNYDAATDSFTPLGTGAACRFACHTIVANKDYVFTAYPKR